MFQAILDGNLPGGRDNQKHFRDLCARFRSEAGGLAADLVCSSWASSSIPYGDLKAGRGISLQLAELRRHLSSLWQLSLESNYVNNPTLQKLLSFRWTSATKTHILVRSGSEFYQFVKTYHPSTSGERLILSPNSISVTIRKWLRFIVQTRVDNMDRGASNRLKPFSPPACLGPLQLLGQHRGCQNRMHLTRNTLTEPWFRDRASVFGDIIRILASFRLYPPLMISTKRRVYYRSYCILYDGYADGVQQVMASKAVRILGPFFLRFGF